MIPLRIRLKGFLSYREEQEIDFQGGTLWMLAGPNGSGKSSIFDAITYALFGAHRGGQQNVEELIHKEANTLEVEFEFRIQDQHYLIQRNAKKSVASTGKVRIATHRQAFRRDPETTRWLPIPETDKDKGFTQWIRQLLGFDYDTFTSSVLLLQNQAEKLLNNDASHRYQVLSHIVDLERYERVWRLAEERRKNTRVEYETVRQHYEQLPSVSAEELAAAQQQVEQLQQQLHQLGQHLESLNHWHRESQRWEDVQRQLVKIHEQLHEARQWCKQANTIEQEHDRWQQLRQVVPVVEVLLTEQGRLQESKLRVQQRQSQRQSCLEQLSRKQAELQRNEQELEQHRRELDGERHEQEQLQKRLQQLGPQLTLCQQWEAACQQASDLEQQLHQLGDNLEVQYRQAQEQLDRLRRDERDFAHLERLHRHQSELRQLVQQLEQWRAQEEQLQHQGQQVRQQYEAAVRQREQAQQQWEQSKQRLAQAQTIAEQARLALAQLRSVATAPTCQFCGQPLTAAHLTAEHQRRQHMIDRATADAQAAQADEQKARQQYQQAQQAEQQLEEQLQQLREQWKEAQQQRRQAEQRLQHLEQDCRDAYYRLTPESQHRISPTPPTHWLACPFPSREELTQLQQQIQQLAAQQQLCQTLEKQLQQRRELEARLAQLRHQQQQLSRQLPTTVNSQQLLTEQQKAHSRLEILRQAVASRQKNIEALDKQGRTLRSEIQRLELDKVRLEAELEKEYQIQQHAQERMEYERRRLPPTWQQEVQRVGLSRWQSWKGELEQLEQHQIETRYRQLQRAREQLEQLEHQYRDLQAQEESFAAEARQGPEHWQTQIATIQEQQQCLIAALSQAMSQHERLRQQQQEHERLTQRLRELQVGMRRWDELARLLGRKGLQLHLLRSSERQIVSYANQILDRLSNGELALRCVQSDDGETPDRALELECVQRLGSGRAINIRFLSGSQKFRVAVALALAIGQYVSRRHQPIECVIIDEGFGCLDREGRQTMIQELHNLSRYLKCILLVSHQEEFAEAFPQGYRFQLQHGSTRVERLQR
jgi:DNA repair exonuclease SbcCD ATPase subunit